MNKFFSNNLPWKIVSLFLATLLWVFVINTQNPILPKEIKTRSITIKGIDELKAKGFALQNEEQLKNMEVRVVVKGPRLEMESLMKDDKGLDIRIDLTPLVKTLTDEGAETREKIVNVIAYSNLQGIEIQEVKPQTVSVIFEKETTVTKNIQTNIKGGNNSEYMALEPLLNPWKVDISGPKTQVEKVHKAVVDVNVDDFTEDALSYIVPVRLVDSKGNEVIGVKKSPNEIQVKLLIGKKKTVPIKPQFKGTLPEGYIKTNQLVMPEQVTIVGAQDIIDQIEDIKLEPISLDNMIQSGTFNVDVLLPADVTIIDKIEGKAVVTVEIQKESFYEYITDTKDIVLHKQGISENYEIELAEGEITLVLSGTAENLLNITGKHIEATIDFTTLGALSEGSYSVPVTFKIPETVKVLTAPTTLQVNVRETGQNVVPEEGQEEDVNPPAESDLN